MSRRPTNCPVDKLKKTWRKQNLEARKSTLKRLKRVNGCCNKQWEGGSNVKMKTVQILLAHEQIHKQKKDSFIEQLGVLREPRAQEN
jgi:cell division protein FtsI/penicillin-binding protein 2